ncbi:hypothetical protein D3C81_1047700 [compost metagenome]
MLAQHVYHHDGRQQFHGTQRQIADRPHMLLKLRSRAGLHCVMAGIMWSRRQFIDEQLAIRGQEHLHRQQANRFQTFGDPGRQSFGLSLHLLLHAGRHDRHMQNIIDMDIFRYRERLNLPARTARRDDGQLLDERDELLQHKRRSGPTQLGVSRCNLVFAADHPLAFAVIAAGGRLQHGREAQPGHGRTQFLLAADLRVRRYLDARRFDGSLLAQPMLRGVQQSAALRHVRCLLQQRGDARVYIFELVRDHIGPRGQFTRGRLVVVAGHDLPRNLSARRIRRRVHRHEPVPEVAPRQRHHPPKLPAAKHPDRCARLDDRSTLNTAHFARRPAAHSAAPNSEPLSSTSA